MTIDQKKKSKAKVMSSFQEKNYPYFIELMDGELRPICTMDCIRIFDKLDELKKEPDNAPTLWSPIHYCNIDIKTMTVVMDSKPDQVLKLVRGKTY